MNAKRSSQCTIIAVANQKGGVGKTTTTVNLAAALVDRQKRVLAVDLDPQGNLTQAVGLQPDRQTRTIWSALDASLRRKEEPALQDCIAQTPFDGFDLVPANIELAQADLDLVSAVNRERKLGRLLQPVCSNYDYILIDCPPHLGLLTINALTAADGLIVPLQAEYLAMNGVNMLFSTVGMVQRELNEQLSIYGVLLTMVDRRNAHSQQVVETTRTALQNKVNVFKVTIGENAALKEAPAAGSSVLRYSPNSRGSQAYRQLAAEVEELLSDGSK